MTTPQRASPPPGAAQPLLRAAGLQVVLSGLHVLDDVSLQVDEGQSVGLIGPNGAGKTTVFNVLCGFVTPQSGGLEWLGSPLRRIRPHDLTRMGVARTLQGLGLFGEMTALENVMAGASAQMPVSVVGALLAWPRNDRRERRLRDDAQAQLERLGVGDIATVRCASLPYGIRKRVVLARALMSRPRLLLLDEPAAGLSEDEIAELAELIRALAGETAVMLVEHHMDLVMAVCERVYVLDFGKVIASGSPDDVRADTAVQEAYLGEAAAGEDDSIADDAPSTPEGRVGSA